MISLICINASCLFPRLLEIFLFNFAFVPRFLLGFYCLKSQTECQRWAHHYYGDIPIIYWYWGFEKYPASIAKRTMIFVSYLTSMSPTWVILGCAILNYSNTENENNTSRKAAHRAIKYNVNIEVCPASTDGGFSPGRMLDRRIAHFSSCVPCPCLMTAKPSSCANDSMLAYPAPRCVHSWMSHSKEFP